jgi:hypothetical protein
MKEEEAETRLINAQPWDPSPGMVKRQCSWCCYPFAAPNWFEVNSYRFLGSSH